MLDAEPTNRNETAPDLPLTYGSYLRVPELLSLQTPLGPEEARDEMLFIITQQSQELWFKQILYDLRAVIDRLESHDIALALHLLGRINKIMQVVGQEVTVLATMPPPEFQRFRHVLSSSSGFESEQFRELEIASGLREPTFIKLIERHIHVPGIWNRWPRSLHDALVDLLEPLGTDATDAAVEIYMHPEQHGQLFLLAEALSEYDVRFGEWRFNHIKLVDRTIGDRAMGTAGSAGSGYLGKTLGYRFFPELWEARNRISAMSAEMHEEN
ncbi:MAG: tryptophan 2,3-dioxygenase [Chloroflexia bacterium]|jgi:tryptophan 2,3-dioxygenase|nr:tryptophan 2,3-dioxygenase [Chloroflexia bacterium]